MKLKKNTKRNVIEELAKVYVVSEEVILFVLGGIIQQKGLFEFEIDKENLSKYAAKVAESPLEDTEFLDIMQPELKTKLQKMIPCIAEADKSSIGIVRTLFVNAVPFEEFDAKLMEIINEHRKDIQDFKDKLTEIMKKDSYRVLIVTG